MSEYQYVEFRAVDRPLTDKELAYAEKQSSRAEISRWRFSNEYNYGSFRGDVDGMLRRGYDVYLEYANYHMRTIKIRLPGLPFEKKLWSKFIDGDRLSWKKGSKCQAGIVTLEPFFDGLDAYWDFGECLDAVVEIRQRLIGSDLRALYVLWLCVAGDENYEPAETVEPPVPVGLQEFDCEVDELFAFFEVDPFLIDAASDDPAIADNKSNKKLAPTAFSPSERLKPWLKSLSAKQAKEKLEQLLIGDTAAVKAELLFAIAEQRACSKETDWPTVELNRTLEDLMKKADMLREEYQAKANKKKAAKAKRDAAKAEREREERLANMIRDPKKWLAETDRLADERGRVNYKLAAEILADLKEAIGGAKGAQIAHKHAAHLACKHPTLTQLKGSLRKRGVLD